MHLVSQPTAPRRLLPFVALSAVLHGALALLPWHAPVVTVQPPLQLALAQPAATAAPASAQTSAAARPLPRPPVDAPVPADRPAPTERSAAPAAPLPAASAQETPSAPEDNARVLAQVRGALARYFTYPLVARRQGWQGEVLLGFSVSPEGHIDHVEVVRSSGHRLLDEAARGSLARLGRLPDYTPHGTAALHLQLPVVYRLANS